MKSGNTFPPASSRIVPGKPGVQPKVATGAQALGGAPPVYRPQNTSPAIQPQISRPPAYRPFATASPVSMKQAHASGAGRLASAPPVYRPQNAAPALQRQAAFFPGQMLPLGKSVNAAANVLQLGKSKVKKRGEYQAEYAPSSDRVDTRFGAYISAVITSTSIDEHHYLNFTATVGRNAYEGHINIKTGYALAHVTIAAGGPLANYWYEVTGAGQVGDAPKRLIDKKKKTEKKLSDLPETVKTAITAMLQNIYN